MYKNIYITNRVNYLYLKGGDFEDDYEEAKLKIRQLLDNTAFFQNNLIELRTRLKKVVAEDENLMALKTKIEYIINKLEEGTKDKNTELSPQSIIANNLDDLVHILETYNNQNMADIVKDIESLLSYIELLLKKKKINKDPDFKKMAEQFKNLKDKLEKNKKTDSD